MSSIITTEPTQIVVVDENNVQVITVGLQGPVGATGATGATGSTGATGAAGAGVATGGTAGQILAKNSGTNYDTGWISTLPIANGGTGATSAQAAMAALKGVYVLASSAVAVSLTGTTSETTLVTYTLSANAMGANGVLRITTGWSNTNSSNTKTTRIKFGGTSYLSATLTTSNTVRDQREIHNRNATNSQVGMTNSIGGFATSSGSSVTSTVDTTSAVTILFTGQLQTSGETMALEYYLIELLVP